MLGGRNGRRAQLFGLIYLNNQLLLFLSSLFRPVRITIAVHIKAPKKLVKSNLPVLKYKYAVIANNRTIGTSNTILIELTDLFVMHFSPLH